MSGTCVCSSGMQGLISGYHGDLCQYVVYNRTGVRAFNTIVTPAKSASADTWVAVVCPFIIGAAYAVVVTRRWKSREEERERRGELQ